MSPVISSVSASISTSERCAGWCGTQGLWVSPKGNNHKVSCPVNMVARPPTPEALWKPIWQDMATEHKTTFAVRGRAPSCCKNMSTCRAPLMTRVASFFSCCRYLWFLMMPSTKMGPISPSLADCTPQAAFCKMEWHLHNSVWIFRGPELRVLLVHCWFGKMFRH